MNIDRILVDIDPTMDKQPALLRSLKLAKSLSAEIELFSVAYNRGIVGHWFINEQFLENSKSQYMELKKRWIDGYVEDAKKEGVSASAYVKWGSETAKEIIHKAKQSQADLLIKSTRHHPIIKHFLMTSTDWLLLRQTQTPVLFTKDENDKNYKVIMAAVDLGNNKEARSRLNEAILNAINYFSENLSATQFVAHCYESISHELMTSFGVGTHGIGAPYENQTSYLTNLKSHHEKLLRQLLSDFNVEEKNQIIAQGSPHDLLPKLVKEHNIDLLVVGVSSQQSFLGGTIEYILDTLCCDVLVVVAE